MTSLNVRTAPNGEKVGTLGYGTHVLGGIGADGRFIKDQEWYQIHHEGTICWISDGHSGSYIAEIK